MAQKLTDAIAFINTLITDISILHPTCHDPVPLAEVAALLTGVVSSSALSSLHQVALCTLALRWVVGYG